MKKINSGSDWVRQIIRNKDAYVADMWERRASENMYTLYRVCSFKEAINTFTYCLAGGKYVALTRDAPTEDEAIQQVGNNEGVAPGVDDPRRAMLARLAAQGVRVAQPPPRKLVEYSWVPAEQFLNTNSTIIKVGINASFCRQGSGLAFEGGGGVVVQIGTPLLWVVIDEEVSDRAFYDLLL